jgi:hypothetical protein
MKVFFGVLLLCFPAVGISKTMTDVIRDGHGDILQTTKKSAFEYCKGVGMRVPTIRELAEWAVLNGAAGIRETAFPDTLYYFSENKALKDEEDRNSSENFRAVSKPSHPQGNALTDFYYNYSGYVAPTSDIQGVVLRSSSPIWLGFGSYILAGDSGKITWDDEVIYPRKNIALKCIAD